MQCYHGMLVRVRVRVGVGVGVRVRVSVRVRVRVGVRVRVKVMVRCNDIRACHLTGKQLGMHGHATTACDYGMQLRHCPLPTPCPLTHPYSMVHI